MDLGFLSNVEEDSFMVSIRSFRQVPVTTTTFLRKKIDDLTIELVYTSARLNFHNNTIKYTYDHGKLAKVKWYISKDTFNYLDNPVGRKFIADRCNDLVIAIRQDTLDTFDYCCLDVGVN